MRIFILGGPGSGKTTISKRIANKFNIPFYELDRLFYERESKGYKVSELTDRKEIVDKFINNKDWISEGVYRQDWLDNILKSADMVFLLQVPKHIRNYRLTKRTILQMLKLNGYRPANLKTLFAFYKFNSQFEKERYREIDERLNRLGITPIVVKSQKELFAKINQ